MTPLEAPKAIRVEALQPVRDAAMETPAFQALGSAHYWQRLVDTGKIGSL